jgi:histone arginine demethylase JMJD6
MVMPSFDSVELPSLENQVADAAQGAKNAAMPAGSLAVGIDRRENLPYDEFIASYVKKNRPVILKNAFPEWKAMQRWTPEYLKQKVGHRTVVVDGKDITLAAHLDNCLASTFENPSAYMREQVIRHVAPELAEDLMPFCQYALPNWLRGFYPIFPIVDGLLNRAGEVELFIGGQGSRLLRRKSDMPGGGAEYGGTGGQALAGFADLHYDPTALPVMLFQIYGRKEWLVFDPADTPYLYAHGRLSEIQSPDAPDLNRYPEFAKATPIRFIQEPGEAAYIPAFWWHATRMLSLSIAVSSTFAHGHHWDAMIEDVVENFSQGSPSRTLLIRWYLRAAGEVKERLGSSVGAHPFEEQALRKALGPFRRKARALLKRS